MPVLSARGRLTAATPQARAQVECAPDAPKYMRIRGWLMDRILSEGLRRGDKLPSESDLAQRFGVSRVTVRQALEALRTDGVIESRHGKGWFLRRVCAVQDLGRLQDYGEALAAMGVQARSEVLDIAECAATDVVAEAFDLPAGGTIMSIARVHIVGGRVMAYDVSFVPLEIARRLREQDLARYGTFAALERALAAPLSFADLTIEIAAAEDEAARRLQIASGTPVFKLTRLTHDRRGFPIDFAYMYGLPDSHQFKVRVPRR